MTFPTFYRRPDAISPFVDARSRDGSVARNYRIVLSLSLKVKLHMFHVRRKKKLSISLRREKEYIIFECRFFPRLRFVSNILRER